MTAIPAPADCPLSVRQLEVMRLTVLGGLQATAVGRQLGISASAVQSHRNRIYRLLGVHNATGAAMVCLRNGWFRHKAGFEIPVRPGPPKASVQKYLHYWQAWLRTEDGGDFCLELLGRIGLKLVRDEDRRLCIEHCH